MANFEGESVVFANGLGELRFHSQRYFSKEPFRPRNIAKIVEHQTLKQNYANNIIHVVDSERSFLRFCVT